MPALRREKLLAEKSPLGLIERFFFQNYFCQSLFTSLHIGLILQIEGKKTRNLFYQLFKIS